MIGFGRLRLRDKAKSLLPAILAIFLCAATPRTANANTITVNIEGESIFLGIGGCSIRRAIENHNAKGQPNKECGPGSGGDTIDLANKFGAVPPP
jgi:hypothetical protein